MDNNWKLSKIKEAIGKSGSIRNEIKNEIARATINQIEAEVSRLSISEAFKLYQSRYHFLQMKGVYNQSFEDLLKRLNEVDNSVNLVITVLRADNQSFIVFTDSDYKECLGVII